jgi:succinate-semialdehyde dehydrogenase/glutarate-semialdehyde dehydrogenase
MAYQSINPNNGKTLKTFEQLTDKQLDEKLTTAATCFQTWKQKSYAERTVIVAKAAALMRGHVDDFAKLATLEMGKRIDEARGEVNFSANILDYYAKNAEGFLAPEKLNPTHGEAHMESSPIGVIFCVINWRASPVRI